MPKSRRRPGAKRHRPWLSPLFKAQIAEFFEHTVRTAGQVSPFKVLYHYTSTEVAKSILSKQEFWATAHDCTNDDAELISATSAVVEAASNSARKSRLAASVVFDTFLVNYPHSMLSEIRTVYLCCFSNARDDTDQWKTYGRQSSGCCLGIRVIEEAPLVSKETISAMFEVVYSESELRESLVGQFDAVAAKLNSYSASPFVCEAGLSALYRLSAFAAIRAKNPKWASEKEVRLATLARSASSATPQERTCDDGEIKRYIPIRLRADSKLIALDEIILGSNQDTCRLKGEFESLLSEKGYRPGTTEYPRISVSLRSDQPQ